MEENEKEQEEIKFVDKRRFADAEEGEVSEKTETSSKLQPPPEAKKQNMADIIALTAWMINTYATNAALFMGLTAHPETGQIIRDMPQAKFAIDGITALFEILKPHLNEFEKKEIQSLLADLQINYVNQSKLL